MAQRKARKERREGIYLNKQRIDDIERKRSLSPLKDSPRSVASGPRSPAHSILSRETKDSDEASPITSTVCNLYCSTDISHDGSIENNRPLVERTRVELTGIKWEKCFWVKIQNSFARRKSLLGLLNPLTVAMVV